MAETWEELKAAALKILGKDAEVPEMPDIVQQAADSMQKTQDEFNKCREDCEAKVLALQNGNDSVHNALKQFEAKIEKSDFKLDSKKKDDLQKIQKARKLLTGKLNVAIKGYEDNDKMLDEVDKHLIQLGKYKQKSPPL
jgi:exonuclease VII small subunit